MYAHPVTDGRKPEEMMALASDGSGALVSTRSVPKRNCARFVAAHLDRTAYCARQGNYQHQYETGCRDAAEGDAMVHLCYNSGSNGGREHPAVRFRQRTTRLQETPMSRQGYS